MEEDLEIQGRYRGGREGDRIEGQIRTMLRDTNRQNT
jgi:hypothetical protein